MAIGGERPETGVRIVIARDDAQREPPWAYSGAAHLPDASYDLTVGIDVAGDVTVRATPSSPELEERVRLIVRTVWRQAKADDEPPARRIVRWRGEK